MSTTTTPQVRFRTIDGVRIRRADSGSSHKDHGLLPNEEPKGGSQVASTLIYGNRDAVLMYSGFTEDQVCALGDWVTAKGRNVTEHWLYWERLAAAIMTAAVARGGEVDG